MKIITLHHNRDFDKFRKVFPSAKFEGFSGYPWNPSFTVTDKEWSANKRCLPKSCQVDEVRSVKP